MLLGLVFETHIPKRALKVGGKMDNLHVDHVGEPAGKKNRGCGLSGFLILMIVANSLTVYVYMTNPEVVTSLYPQKTHTAVYLLVFIACINVILAAAIWAWKKWAVYGLYASIIIVFGINIYLGIGLLGSLPGFVAGLIVFFTTKKRWSHFS
jgi:uncharacterized membrane protein